MSLIAHFSDLHLLSLEGLRPLDLAGKRITGAANLLFNRGGQYLVDAARALVRDVNTLGVDHVVVSGDLSNLSLRSEFSLAREVLGQLTLPASRVTVVPGNHDCYTPDAARDELFETHLGQLLRGDLQPGPGVYPFLSLQEDLAVLALSSARVSAPLLAIGTIGGRQLRLAEALLGRPECAGRFRVVVLHHPPCGPHAHWHNNLTDHQAFAAMLSRAGADLVLHGHIHRQTRQALAGPGGEEIPVISAASGTWLSPDDPSRRAQYNLYQIQGQRLEQVIVRRFDPGQGVFEEYRSQP